MARRNKKRKNQKRADLGVKISLPPRIKRQIAGVLMFLASIIITLAFFESAGVAGTALIKGGRALIGESVFIIPFLFFLSGFIFFTPVKLASIKFILAAVLIFILGISGILGSLDQEVRQGGWLGYVLSWPLLKYFGFWVAQIIFIGISAVGFIIFWYFLRPFLSRKEKEESFEKPSVFRKIFAPKFETREIQDIVPQEAQKEEKPTLAGPKQSAKFDAFAYTPPPFDILDVGKEVPTSGDIKMNSVVIKRTFQNFGIDVAMSEVNIGPTVTQYTLKPAEGIKLSKITALSNDLSLALASHPIRIEAPIPGRSLVGIEVPNKIRANVRLRDLIENEKFQQLPMNLTVALGKDVSGFPVYTDLTRMPHLLVAGSTGTGKTIFLNSLMLSLLFQPSGPQKSSSPEYLRFILVDPKRVEFSTYSNLPHLLCPIIYNANQTINALKWLALEMERRFEILSEEKARNIFSHNEKALKNNGSPLPFIVVVIDELADLMAAKGRDIEAAIARLAQMARAVGIHLVVATQRPSVEVITGLIKANITSRVTFQVASQVDSRTVIDAAGAEKLLGSGDMLYISSEFGKPKRIQGAYVSEKELRKVINHIISSDKEKSIMNKDLVYELEKTSVERGESDSFYKEGDDPFYEEAKRVVFESQKASASLLQRRLKVGYARAARLLDMLEERGIVGPADGAKPRDIYAGSESSSEENGKDEWEKI